MITYEKAKAKALETLPEADSVLEYKDAWIFYNSKARGNDTEDNQVIIEKTTGKMLSDLAYSMKTTDNNPPKRRHI